MLRKIITVLIGGGTAVFATLTLTAAPLSASPGPNPDALGDHGWGCIDAVHAVHCAPPGIAPKIGTTPAIPVLVFDTRDPDATNAPFLGTEFNIAPAQFHGQPCPTDPDSQQYTFLPDIGFPLPYYACHRFDSPLP